MATSSKLVEPIDDITECCICAESYTIPKVLPCIHTFCLICLEVYAKDVLPGEQMPCPLCRLNFLVPVGGVAKLPGNFFVEKLLEVNKSNKEDKTIQCDICSDDNAADETRIATGRCLDCCENLCSQWRLVHMKLSVSKMHKVVEIGSQQASMSSIKSSFCVQHLNCLIQLYCNDCNTGICLECLDDAHRSHNCSGIEKVSKFFSKMISNDVTVAIIQLVKFKKQAMLLEEMKTDFVDCVRKAKLDITNKGGELKGIIERHTNELLQELKEFETAKEEVECQIAALECFRKYSQEVLEKATSIDMAQIGNSLHSRGIALQATQAITNPSFNVILISNYNIEHYGSKKGKGSIVGSISETSPCIMHYPVRLHTISGSEIVQGITILDRKIFVVRKMQSFVNMYDATSFCFLSKFKVNELSDSRDIISCSHNNCLYISDYAQLIHRVCGDDNRIITNWAVDGKPYGLSVNCRKMCNLLVTSESGNVEEYTTDGNLVRVIHLPWTYKRLLHAIELEDSQFLVCNVWRQADQSHTVCIVNAADDKCLYSFGSTPGSGLKQLNSPLRCAIDKDGNVFVADYGNDRVLLLNRSLQPKWDLITVKNGLKSPSRLHLDERNGRLYVGSEEHILVFKIK